MRDKITKTEFDCAKDALNSILAEPVENIALESIPIIEDLCDNNKVYKGKLSILFVDIRKSTDLTDELKSKKMVKVYRSFIRIVIQAIRYSGGYTRQFAGDGVMGVFQDSEFDGSKLHGSQKAIDAARYIVTMVDFCLNPLLKKYIGNESILGCGVGVCTGNILITKTGMRGKEKDGAEENELGIAWVGSTTNYASKHCSLANSCEIFIDNSTFNELQNKEDIWQKVYRTKGVKVYEGYTSYKYYWPLEDEMVASSVITEENDNTNNIQESFINKILKDAIFEIQEKTSSIILKQIELDKKEKALNSSLENIDKRENNLKKKELELEYDVKFDMVETLRDRGDESIKALGKDYCYELINRIKDINKQLNNRTKFTAYEAATISNIYLFYEEYWEYYQCLVMQAKNGWGIWMHGISPILDKIHYWDELIEILESRIEKESDSEDRDRHIEILKKLKTL